MIDTYEVNHEVNARPFCVKPALAVQTPKKSKYNKNSKGQTQLTCYRCHQLGHGIKTCIWDASKSNIKCHACGIFGHCNNPKFSTVKTAAFVQGVQNVNVTTNSHDPNYDKFITVM